MKIYWTHKSIPELKDLSMRERGRRWRSAYKSAFRHWQTWGGVVLCGVLAGAVQPEKISYMRGTEVGIY